MVFPLLLKTLISLKCLSSTTELCQTTRGEVTIVELFSRGTASAVGISNHNLRGGIVPGITRTLASIHLLELDTRQILRTRRFVPNEEVPQNASHHCEYNEREGWVSDKKFAGYSGKPTIQYVMSDEPRANDPSAWLYD